MHVERSHISKAGVNPYYGYEIPKWDELGLDPDKVYMVFRPPDELQKGLATANRIPILAVHKQVTAQDPKKELIIGTTGSSAQFDGEYLDNDLAFWDGEYIPKIEKDEQRELSSAYRYIPVLSKGAYNGAQYDIVMTGIEFNHVCLVVDGRAGPDVLVADSQIHPPVKAKTVKLNPKQLEALKKRLPKLKLAMDEGLDTGAVETALEEALEEVQALGETADTTTAQDDGNGEVLAMLKQIIEKLSGGTEANDEAAATAEAAKKTPAAENAGAMDSASVQKMIDENTASTEKRIAARFAAVEAVAPITGKLDPMAFDSAESIYGHALKVGGIETKDHDKAGFKGMFEMMLANRGKRVETPEIAGDANTAADLFKRFPHLANIKQA
ncbi:DUF2213 domain-containing protein [Pararobbsia alpina]|uniref:DUF2213 domain-containing protein n=1 Tax=Pararobbsia alpina TaxID=621374 RepID=UPI0039A73AE5